MKKTPTSVSLANPRGFCAGVERAIAIVDRILETNGSPVYVKHEIVHNRIVVDGFKQRGVIFIEDPNEVPVGAILVYSAHGVSEAVRQAAQQRQLVVHDATCPLVTKVHTEVKRLRAAHYEIVMIGHAGHPEVEGTLGQANDGTYLVENTADVEALTVNNANRLAYITQTTLSVDDTTYLVDRLKQRFPNIVAPAKSDICYATQNRQEAVKELATSCDVVLVVGSPTSSNSNRLCEVARQQGTAAYLIDTAADIQLSWLQSAQRIGITAGASAPERLVQELVSWLRQQPLDITVREINGVEENITFSIPKRLMRESNRTGNNI